MSRFSGCCDLFDHLCTEKHRTADGSDSFEALDKAKVLYSDPMECFKIFKKKTQGKLYQHKNIKEVNIYNQDFIAEHCKNFKIIKHAQILPDRRTKTGSKEITTYTYEYWGKEYTAKELKKKGGVYILIEIKFETLLDLIPYFPYTISMCYWEDAEEFIIISDESAVEDSFNNSLKYGHLNDTYYYRQNLSEFYKECVLKYFTSTINEPGLWLL